ncbi:hypothetical protein ACTHQY_10815 [Rhodococcoides corynebacterioides]|uniref:hypothetical protein n=1 Tax=Rhodococcoides corynebacterioides TaxID=53972 RepID=UPI003F8183D8
MIDPRLEHFLLYELDDDWMPLGPFVGTVRQIDPENCSTERVAAIIEEFIRNQWMIPGSWSTETGTWEPWHVNVEEAMARIAEGYEGEAGYIGADEEELATTEVFRGEITEVGRRRLDDLGSPYEKYGDPWESNPSLKAEGDFTPWRP